MIITIIIAVALALIVGIISHFATVLQPEEKCREQDRQCGGKSKGDYRRCCENC